MVPPNSFVMLEQRSVFVVYGFSGTAITSAFMHKKDFVQNKKSRHFMMIDILVCTARVRGAAALPHYPRTPYKWSHCIKSENDKCWKYHKMILSAEHTEKVARCACNTQIIAENGSSEVGRWFWYIIWFLEQLMKLDLSIRCDVFCRAFGCQIVYLCCVDMLQQEIMNGRRFMGIGGRFLTWSHLYCHKVLSLVPSSSPKTYSDRLAGCSWL